MSPSRMRQVKVLLVVSSKITHVNMKGPNKSIELKNLTPYSKQIICLSNVIRWQLFSYLHLQFTVPINYLCTLDATSRTQNTWPQIQVIDFMIFIVFFYCIIFSPSLNLSFVLSELRQSEVVELTIYFLFLFFLFSWYFS